MSKNASPRPRAATTSRRRATATRVTIYNVLEGHGFGKLIVGFALRSARKGADDFAGAIKAAVEKEVPAA